jgi:hypothetical protein
MSDDALMMEAARTSETSVDNYFTRQYIPEDKSELHNSPTFVLSLSHTHTHTHIFILSVSRPRHLNTSETYVLHWARFITSVTHLSQQQI